MVRCLEPGPERQPAVNEAFAEAHGLGPGDRLGAVSTVGSACSPCWASLCLQKGISLNRPGGLSEDAIRLEAGTEIELTS
ncbi:hypothetical protein AN478_09020 [Thiohalorhabdus denitrificans]|uniref:hypothetical protein n=1 Tax=Thiohalorhabdus denitrificans TaxID=381306 RepID=UPI0006D579AA|nr:hypothetical protein [Thiohalorhabdus denitrificans]KPV40246.1 hypothetical protein AN478_09020 [Thiohalorhabdus denitrificans]